MNKQINKALDISKILSLHVSGQDLNMEERKQLDEWLAYSESNKILLCELQNKELAKSRREVLSRIDMDKEWATFQQSIKKEKKLVKLNWINLLKYAAVIALPILLATYLFLEVDTQQNYVSDIFVEIEPGVKRAQLILSNGEKIELDENKKDLTNGELNVKIENKNQSLNYTSLNSEAKELRFNHLLIGRGEEYQLILSDGTKVWLNSESKLSYPTRFASNIREVELEGEAYFEVTKNKKAPFIVKTKQMDVEVLGTSFNVSAYQDEDKMKTTLVEGSVKVVTNYGITEAKIIKPDEQAIFDMNSNKMTIGAVDAKMYGRWREGVFAFEEDNLDEIMRKLARWYKVRVFFQDDEARHYQFSGKLPRFESCNELLDMIEKTTNVTFEVKNNENIIVRTK